MNLELVSEDERRKLYELIFDKHWKVMKVLEVEKDCEIGNHYHKKKDELFLVVSGELRWFLIENIHQSIKHGIFGTAEPMDIIYVPRYAHHLFECKAGTVIIGLATELHDDSDDYKL